MKYYSVYFGQAYGSGAYGNGTYSCTTQQVNDGTCNTAASSGSNSGGTGGTLTNTGIAVAVIVTLACLIIFVSLAVRIWRRKPNLAAEPVEAEESDSDDDASKTA